MTFNIFIQSCIALMFLVFSTVASWYEGSKILHLPWEWKYTAIFSKVVNGPVEKASDILPIDHFVYAAKFAPTFPIIMLLSSTYLLILVGYILFKHNDKKFSYFLSSIGVLFLVLSGFVSNSPTIGLKYFFTIFLFIGIISIVIALIRIFQYMTKDQINKGSINNY
ncbi:YjdJ family protein [Psychrobacillus vulpis]|nr:YjdJ family protein [Psychrobacillus vulpis]